MNDSSSNHYERAFESWLIDNHIQYVPIDESKKTVFGRVKIKTFDFLVYPRGQQPKPYVIITEVKGKLFK
ncbi:MAG: HYExAFE family protein, partial [Planctomycetota bacterium]